MVTQESKTQVSDRLDDILATLRYWTDSEGKPIDSAILVGHSHLFRAMMKCNMDPTFKAKHPAWTRALARKKLNNCACLCIEVEWPVDPSAKAAIVDANLMFGTSLSDGSTRESIEGAAGAHGDVDPDANVDCAGAGGILQPTMTLDEFVAGVTAERTSEVGGKEEEQDHERWSDVSVSDTECER